MFQFYSRASVFFSFFFNDTAPPEIYTLSLHDALPISCSTTAPVNRYGSCFKHPCSFLTACRTSPSETRPRKGGYGGKPWVSFCSWGGEARAKASDAPLDVTPGP